MEPNSPGIVYMEYRTVPPPWYYTVESGLIQTVAKLEVGKISVGLYYMWKK